MLRGQPSTVLEMKAWQTALAVRRIERLWKQAWVEATTTPPASSMWDGLENLPPATQPATQATTAP
jgi:transposase InsO family protein